MCIPFSDCQELDQLRLLVVIAPPVSQPSVVCLLGESVTTELCTDA